MFGVDEDVFKDRREQAREEKERLKLEEEKYRELLFAYDGEEIARRKKKRCRLTK